MEDVVWFLVVLQFHTRFFSVFFTSFNHPRHTIDFVGVLIVRQNALVHVEQKVPFIRPLCSTLNLYVADDVVVCIQPSVSSALALLVRLTLLFDPSLYFLSSKMAAPTTVLAISYQDTHYTRIIEMNV